MTEMKKLGSMIVVEAHHETPFSKGAWASMEGQSEAVLGQEALGTLNGNTSLRENSLNRLNALLEVRDSNLLALVGAGFDDGVLWWANRMQNGRNLAQCLEAMFHEQFPLAQDHTVLVFSHIAGALSVMHAMKFEGEKVLHGVLSPFSVWVTHTGEVKLKDFHLCGITSDPNFRNEAAECMAYQSDRVRIGNTPTVKDDIFAAGAVFFEMVAREQLRSENADTDVAARLAEAKDGLGFAGTPIPDDLYLVLQKCLLQDRPDAYQDIDGLKTDLEDLMNQGAYAPTTFNLALFMNTVFRGDDEKDQKMAAKVVMGGPAPVAPAAEEEEATSKKSKLKKPTEKTHSGVSKLKAKAIDVAHDSEESDDSELLDIKADIPKEKKGAMMPLLILVVVAGSIGGYFWYKNFTKEKAQSEQRATEQAKIDERRAMMNAKQRRAAGIFFINELTGPEDLAPRLVDEINVVVPDEVRAKVTKKTKVHFKVFIDAGGSVIDVQPMDGWNGLPELLLAYEEAAMQWKFDPGMKDGEPVKVWDDRYIKWFDPSK